MSVIATVSLVALAIAAMIVLRLLISRALLQARIATHSDDAGDALQRRFHGCGRTTPDTPERSHSDAT